MTLRVAALVVLLAIGAALLACSPRRIQSPCQHGVCYCPSVCTRRIPGAPLWRPSPSDCRCA